jgi:hypothetical protein
MKRIIILLILVISYSPANAHKTYVSIADMQYDTITQEIEVSLKLTAHDFEHILEKKYNQKMHIENISDSSVVGLFIQNYLKTHFKIESKAQLAQFNYVGKEVTLRDELYFYFTFSKVLNPQQIKVSNTILFEMFTKQQNIVNYQYINQTKSVTLTNSNPQALIILKN